ncbi:hypothetical protein Vretifemale_15394, partial [Volvox reticuliferus]
HGNLLHDQDAFSSSWRIWIFHGTDELQPVGPAVPCALPHMATEMKEAQEPSTVQIPTRQYWGRGLSRGSRAAGPYPLRAPQNAPGALASPDPGPQASAVWVRTAPTGSPRRGAPPQKIS